MLKEIGYDSFDDLFKNIPQEAMFKGTLNIPEGKSELEVCRQINNTAKKNVVFDKIFRGAGAYNHYVPSTVDAIGNKEEFLMEEINKLSHYQKSELTCHSITALIV